MVCSKVFWHRVPALSAALMSSIALGISYWAGISCDFIRVVSFPYKLTIIRDYADDIVAGQEAYTNENIHEDIYFHSIGVFCRSDLYNADGMWTMSRIFLIIALVAGFATITVAWSISLFIPPNGWNWKCLSIVSAIAATLQIPVFLLFDSTPCKIDMNHKCQIRLGSFLLVCSCVLYVAVTILTQWLDPPRWASEANVWKVKTHQKRSPKKSNYMGMSWVSSKNRRQFLLMGSSESEDDDERRNSAFVDWDNSSSDSDSADMNSSRGKRKSRFDKKVHRNKNETDLEEGGIYDVDNNSDLMLRVRSGDNNSRISRADTYDDSISLRSSKSRSRSRSSRGSSNRSKRKSPIPPIPEENEEPTEHLDYLAYVVDNDHKRVKRKSSPKKSKSSKEQRPTDTIQINNSFQHSPSDNESLLYSPDKSNIEAKVQSVSTQDLDQFFSKKNIDQFSMFVEKEQKEQKRPKKNQFPIMTIEIPKNNLSLQKTTKKKDVDNNDDNQKKNETPQSTAATDEISYQSKSVENSSVQNTGFSEGIIHHNSSTIETLQNNASVEETVDIYYENDFKKAMPQSTLSGEDELSRNSEVDNNAHLPECSQNTISTDENHYNTNKQTEKDKSVKKVMSYKKMREHVMQQQKERKNSNMNGTKLDMDITKTNAKDENTPSPTSTLSFPESKQSYPIDIQNNANIHEKEEPKLAKHSLSPSRELRVKRLSRHGKNDARQIRKGRYSTYGNKVELETDSDADDDTIGQLPLRRTFTQEYTSDTSMYHNQTWTDTSMDEEDISMAEEDTFHDEKTPVSMLLKSDSIRSLDNILEKNRINAVAASEITEVAGNLSPQYTKKILLSAVPQKFKTFSSTYNSESSDNIPTKNRINTVATSEITEVTDNLSPQYTKKILLSAISQDFKKSTSAYYSASSESEVSSKPFKSRRARNRKSNKYSKLQKTSNATKGILLGNKEETTKLLHQPKSDSEFEFFSAEKKAHTSKTSTLTLTDRHSNEHTMPMSNLSPKPESSSLNTNKNMTFTKPSEKRIKSIEYPRKKLSPLCSRTSEAAARDNQRLNQLKSLKNRSHSPLYDKIQDKIHKNKRTDDRASSITEQIRISRIKRISDNAEGKSSQTSRDSRKKTKDTSRNKSPELGQSIERPNSISKQTRISRIKRIITSDIESASDCSSKKRPIRRSLEKSILTNDVENEANLSDTNSEASKGYDLSDSLHNSFWDDVESESGETRSNSVASRVRKLNNLKNRSPPTPRYVSSNSREVRHHSDNEAPMPRRLLLLSNQSPLARRLDLIGTK